ncbi:MAG: hypothetical protein PHU03_07735 [Syntrophales bacterium]|nr:hypothetical protein [Syntrophales bacterium]
MTQQRLDELEILLNTEAEKIDRLFREGRIPTQGDYAELDRLKKELKTARILDTKARQRTAPLLDRSVTLKMPLSEYEELSRRATENGVSISLYIRTVIGKHLESGD